MGTGVLFGTGAAVWVAAALAPPLSAGVFAAAATAVAALGLGVGRPVLVALGVVVLAACVASRAEGRHVPLDAGTLSACGDLVAEARPARGGWRSEVDLAEPRARVELRAFGGEGARVAGLRAGDRVCGSGPVRPVAASGWSRSRHVVGRWTLQEVSTAPGEGAARRAVEAVRARVLAGGDALAERHRPLYHGLVLGEDRFQPPEQRARFRAAGLTHLLAVSGQNVAFVLAATRPLVRLVPRRGRLLMVAGLLAAFAMATRFEPSVLRAVSMAAIGAWSAHTGRQVDGVRVLAVAVIALIFADPFLVHAIGFQLSAAASAGIVVLAPVIERRLPVPPWAGEPIAVTVAAQLAVLPLQLAWFGPVSFVAVPANVAAGPAAGAVMLWGVVVGPVAGVLPGSVGWFVQLPATGLVAWIDAVARVAADAPLPRWSGADWAMAAAAAVVLWAVRAAVVRLVLIAAMAAVVAMSWPTGAAAVGVVDLDGGGRLHYAEDGSATVLVVDADATDALLDAVLAQRVGDVDLVVSEVGSGPGGAVARSVAALVRPDVLLAPSDHRLVGATRWRAPVELHTAGGALHVDERGGRLVVVAQTRG